MGLELKNPLIIGSSGLTRSIEKLREFEVKGAAAVVLKSIFEEQIMYETNSALKVDESLNDYPEALDYIKNLTRDNSVSDYLKLIREAKAALSIPVFASVNCVSSKEWVSIAKDIENAGADGLELNVFILPLNPEMSSEELEQKYFDIIDNVKKQIKIPVALKLGSYFSGLSNVLQKMSWTGVSSLVLFNRFLTPDIHLKDMKLHMGNPFSSPLELGLPLRWVAMLSGKIRCDISATTGIHDAEGVIKMLLAGATTTQVCSTLYLNGADRIVEILHGLEAWMAEHNFANIEAFRGMLSMRYAENVSMYQRVQYLKYISGIEY